MEKEDWRGARGQLWNKHLEAMEIMLAPVNAPLIEALSLTGAHKVADIGCGGGGSTRAVAAAAPDAQTHGYDISQALIDAARKAGDDDARFVCADVTEVTGNAGAFDRLTSRFGVMFFDDPARAFSHLLGWLSPGGRFAFAVWGPPPDNPWMRLVRDAVDAAIGVPPSDPDGPGPFRYADAAVLSALLDQAGAVSVETTVWRGWLPFGGGLPLDQAVDFAFSAFSLAADALAGASAADGEKAKALLMEAFEPYDSEAGVLPPAQVNIVSGTV